MPQSRSWPIRYRVTITPVSGVPRAYEVLTWLDQSKAIALAVQRDTLDHPNVPERLYAIDAKEIGEAPRTETGTVEVGTDLYDRMEF